MEFSSIKNQVDPHCVFTRSETGPELRVAVLVAVKIEESTKTELLSISGPLIVLVINLGPLSHPTHLCRNLTFLERHTRLSFSFRRLRQLNLVRVMTVTTTGTSALLHTGLSLLSPHSACNNHSYSSCRPHPTHNLGRLYLCYRTVLPVMTPPLTTLTSSTFTNPVDVLFPQSRRLSNRL